MQLIMRTGRARRVVKQSAGVYELGRVTCEDRLVSLVYLVYLVCSDWSDRPDRPDEADHPRLSRSVIVQDCVPVVRLCRCALADASLESAYTYVW